ncbi:MAG: TlyA family RNA methyltransferase [Candidatus Margulisiibacteriota bacterium]
MKKLKLDELLVTRGFISSKDEAQRYILAGKILIDDKVITQPGTLCELSSHIRIKEKKSQFVSRGGDKLAGFINKNNIDIKNKCVLDVGISTGGFSDVLIQGEALHVLGIDVGYGILDYKLRKKNNLSLLERTNAREVTKKEINDSLRKHHLTINDINLVVMDVSFISAFKIIPNLINLLQKECEFIILIKPQFEAKKELVEFGGVITNEDNIHEILTEVNKQFSTLGFEILINEASSLKGTKGNQEHFYFVKQKYLP